MSFTSRKILLSIIIFGFNRLLFLHSSSAFKHSQSGNGKCEKVLTFLTPFEEVFELKHDGKWVDLELVTPKTVGMATGGVLGDVIYRLHKFRFYWDNGSDSKSCVNGTTLNSRIIYYNTKYGSFENALNHPDGLVDVFVPVETNGHISNPLYCEFEKAFRNKIKKPGDHTLINGGITYVWYEYFNNENIYKSYHSASTYFDEDSDKTRVCMLTIELPLNRRANFISHEQFKNTFGSLVDCKGKSLNHPIPPMHQALPAIKNKGISIINIPA